MRLLPGRGWMLPLSFLAGAAVGLLFLTYDLTLGLIAAAVFGGGAVAISLGF